MFKLVISDDEGKQTVVPLVRDEITIGRKEGNTIRLTERNVSRRHARLAKANGKFVVEDLHSYNGVKVNGQKVNIPSYQLKAEDQVSVKEGATNQARILAAMEFAQQRGISEWLDVDPKKLVGTYKVIPDRSDLPADINEQLVVELYSK